MKNYQRSGRKQAGVVGLPSGNLALVSYGTIIGVYNDEEQAIFWTAEKFGVTSSKHRSTAFRAYVRNGVEQLVLSKAVFARLVRYEGGDPGIGRAPHNFSK